MEWIVRFSDTCSGPSTSACQSPPGLRCGMCGGARSGWCTSWAYRRWPCCTPALTQLLLCWSCRTAPSGCRKNEQTIFQKGHSVKRDHHTLTRPLSKLNSRPAAETVIHAHFHVTEVNGIKGFLDVRPLFLFYQRERGFKSQWEQVRRKHCLHRKIEGTA